MHCDSCRFDGAAWTDSDLVRTLDVFPDWWRDLAAGGPAEALQPYADVIAALPRLVADVDAVHRGWHALAEASRVRHAAGHGATTTTGRVVQVSASGGGVPKLPMLSGRITAAGLEGDRQATRKHHGRPWQAICLWSAEVVDGLAADGHPIGYGSAGENLTVSGLDWSTMRAGIHLRIGDVLLETTTLAIPCRQNGRWFSDGRFSRLKHSPRRYARVLEDGEVAPGDTVVVEPLPLLLPQQTPGAPVTAGA